jgi:hypothetical protein
MVHVSYNNCFFFLGREFWVCCIFCWLAPSQPHFFLGKRKWTRNSPLEQGDPFIIILCWQFYSHWFSSFRSQAMMPRSMMLLYSLVLLWWIKRCGHAIVYRIPGGPSITRDSRQLTELGKSPHLFMLLFHRLLMVPSSLIKAQILKLIAIQHSGTTKNFHRPISSVNWLKEASPMYSFVD